MAFKHGKNAVFKVDNSSGTLTDISSYLKEISLPRKVDTAETTVFGKDSKTYIVGLKDGTVSVSGMWDSTLDAHLASILGQDASVTFEYGPAGSATGAIKFTGEAFLTSFETSSPVGDVVSFSAEFQCSDSITRTTF